MDGVKVGHDALLPGAQGLAGPFGCLNSARYVLPPSILINHISLMSNSLPYTITDTEYHGAQWELWKIVSTELEPTHSNVTNSSVLSRPSNLSKRNSPMRILKLHWVCWRHCKWEDLRIRARLLRRWLVWWRGIIVGRRWSTRGECWIFWVGMRVAMSMCFSSLNRKSMYWWFLFVWRYHVGRHVANLQVVNTYEGTYVCRFLILSEVLSS